MPKSLLLIHHIYFFRKEVVLIKAEKQKINKAIENLTNIQKGLESKSKDNENSLEEAVKNHKNKWKWHLKNVIDADKL